MRWQRKQHRLHQLGERRTMKGFLYLPMRIGIETRWLERAVWEERCFATGGEANPGYHRWTLARWISP